MTKLNHPQVFSQSLITYEESMDMEIEERKNARLKRTTSSHHQLNRISKLPNVENVNPNPDFVENGFQMGLKNFGNTCYINAFVQCLFSIKSIIVFCYKFELVHQFVIPIVDEIHGSRHGAMFTRFMALLHVAWQNNNPPL